jgi:isopentenyl diphosphate isomerase/L-lactate dehydrogenase-like FMN-dependent dehydrogenase
VTVAGTNLAFPVGITSTGLSGIVTSGADEAGARAAARRRTVFILATLANSSIEAVAAAASGPLWFQLYTWRDRAAVDRLIGRAEVAGFEALVVTVDCPDIGNRERDRRNGFQLPPRPTLRNAWDVLRHPRWTRSMLAGVDFPNVRAPDVPAPRGLLAALRAAQAANESLYNCRVTVSDLQWLRRRWSGPLVVKGVLSLEDAITAADLGADAVVVSNHGGRQLDGTSASLTVLPEVAAAVGDRVDVLLDSGIRRGSDVVKAMALGARACLIGRPWLYGLAAGGETGVEHVLSILREEMQRTVRLMGLRSLSDLDASWVQSTAVRLLNPATDAAKCPSDRRRLPAEPSAARAP